MKKSEIIQQGCYVYLRTEPLLWTVGFYKPDGRFEPESDHDNKEDAAKRVAWLNGVTAAREALDEALNSGDGTYKP